MSHQLGTDACPSSDFTLFRIRVVIEMHHFFCTLYDVIMRN